MQFDRVESVRPRYPSCEVLDKESLRDGRSSNQARDTYVRLGVVSNSTGSAYLEFGSTRVLCCIYGPRPAPRSAAYTLRGRLECSVRIAPFARVHRSPVISRDPSEEEIDLSMKIREAMEDVLMLDLYPKSVVDVMILVIQDDGGVLPTSMNAASIALVEGGFSLRDMVTASCAITIDDKILLDPCFEEERRADGIVTVATASSLNNVETLLQNGNMTSDRLSECVDLCLDACGRVRDVFSTSLKSKFQELNRKSRSSISDASSFKISS